MCANFQPITQAQASRFTNKQLSFDFNADQYPFISQFHKPEDEKRSIVVIEPEHRQDWLNMHHEDAFELLKPMGAGYVAEHLPKPKKPLKTAQMDVFNR